MLGDVQACVDDQPIDLGHARQRCVLAALLVDVNRPVSIDQLLDRVWGERPPQRARGALHTYVSRLRQVLDHYRDINIRRQPAGYVLVADPLVVDLHQFRHLLGRARAAVSDADAVSLLERALRLWRGEAFAGLDTPWLAAVRGDLDRVRLAAELDLNDAALRCGRHASLIPTLSAGVSTYPLDERLAGQYMLALYRGGRQADALGHYEQLRLRLAEELGADPSPPLRQLHQQILTGDPALAAATPDSTRTAAAPVVPHQLPAPQRSFVGRTDELARLDALLIGDSHQPAPIVVAVAGTAGIGKTTLAVQWANQVANRFPDGHLYVNLRGFQPGAAVMDPAHAVRGFLDALGVPPQRIPADPDAQAALYRTVLAGRRILIVADNARDADQVRPLLPGSSGCLVVVTSRNQLAGLVAAHGAQPVTLPVLTPAEARELLVRRIGPDRAAADPHAVEGIVKSSARLPLALAIVAARAAAHPTFPLTALADELHEAHRPRLDAFDGGDPTVDIRTVFSWSYQRLSTDAARLFRLLGLHPGPDASSNAAASLAGLAVLRTRSLLAELTRAHLIVEHLPGRYTFHDLLRAYAAEQADQVDPDSARRAALHRMFDHYLHTGYAAALLLDPNRDPPFTLPQPESGVATEQLTDHDHAFAWFVTEHVTLLATIDQAVTTDLDIYACYFPWILKRFLDRRAQWRDLRAAYCTALAAAGRLNDKLCQAEAHEGLGGAYTRLDEYEDAHQHIGHAVRLYRQIGDLVGLGHALWMLSHTVERQGRFPEALDHARQAFDVFQAAGYRAGQANTLDMIGWCHAKLGHHQQALTASQQALALAQEISDRWGQASAWHGLGYAHLQLGDHAQAVDSFLHARDLFDDVGDRYWQADALVSLGDAHLAAGNPHAGGEAWQHALHILDELDHPDAHQVRTKFQGTLEQRNESTGRLPATQGRSHQLATVGLSGEECLDCGRRVEGPFEETTTGRRVCPDCGRALRLGSSVGAITHDVGAGFGVWAMLMRRFRRQS